DRLCGPSRFPALCRGELCPLRVQPQAPGLSARSRPEICPATLVRVLNTNVLFLHRRIPSQENEFRRQEQIRKLSGCSDDSAMTRQKLPVQIDAVALRRLLLMLAKPSELLYVSAGYLRLDKPHPYHLR